MEQTEKVSKKQMVNDAILKEISEAVRGIAFGTVTIKINQSKIVQIEVAENKRFDDVWSAESGGGI